MMINVRLDAVKIHRSCLSNAVVSRGIPDYFLSNDIDGIQGHCGFRNPKKSKTDAGGSAGAPAGPPLSSTGGGGMITGSADTGTETRKKKTAARNIGTSSLSAKDRSIDCSFLQIDRCQCRSQIDPRTANPSSQTRAMVHFACCILLLLKDNIEFLPGCSDETIRFPAGGM